MTKEYTNLNNKIDINYYIENGEVVLDFIKVPKELRGKGHAKKEMENFIDFWSSQYEEKGLETIGLCSYPQEQGVDAGRLNEFYENLGFMSLGESGGATLMEYKF